MHLTYACIYLFVFLDREEGGAAFNPVRRCDDRAQEQGVAFRRRFGSRGAAARRQV